MSILDKEFETVSLDTVDQHILLVTLDRPSAANALNTQMGYDLRELWLELYRDPASWRAVVLTGRGEKAFCAGGDLKERNNMSDEVWQTQHALFEQMTLAMIDCPVALTEVTLGIMPGAMGTQNLPRAVGVRRAKEIILTGTPISADEALEWGILNKVCDNDSLLDEALATARTIAANAPISIRQAKKSINVSTQVDLKTGYAFEIEAYNRMVSTDDRLEGIRAFNEKRKAEFRGK